MVILLSIIFLFIVIPLLWAILVVLAKVLAGSATRVSVSRWGHGLGARSSEDTGQHSGGLPALQYPAYYCGSFSRIRRECTKRANCMIYSTPTSAPLESPLRRGFLMPAQRLARLPLRGGCG